MRSLRIKLVVVFLGLIMLIGTVTLTMVRYQVLRDYRAVRQADVQRVAEALRDALAGGADREPALAQAQALSGFAIALTNRPPGVDAWYVSLAWAGGTIEVRASTSQLDALKARLRTTMLLGAGVGFVGMLLLAYLFVRLIVRPLQAMSRAADRLSRGQYDGPAPPDVGGELGSLSRALVHLTTEVKRRVVELTQHRDLLAAVIGRLVEGVVVVDGGGAFVLANDTATSMMGGAERALAPSLLPIVQAALADGAAEQEIALRDRTVQVTARRLPEQAGAIAVLYDVTRMRSLESVRREFLSNAAHELRTPVTAIAGYAETLLHAAVAPATRDDFLTIIHRNAERLSRLVTDLLLLERLEAREHAVEAAHAVALAPVLAHAVRTCQALHPAARFDIAIDPALQVLGTTEGLEHVVQNLVDNAAKYGGSSVTSVVAERRDGSVLLTVRDGGPGIAPEHITRLFERFYRVDEGRSRSAGGTGLGLAIVKRHVEAMGGTITVTSELGVGTKFTVVLRAG